MSTPSTALPPEITIANSPQPKPMAAPSPAAALDTTKYKPNAKDPSLNSKTWQKRADGSSKSTGFLGLLKRPDGRVSSEISIGVTINGKEIEVPTMVPTLTQQELDFLMTHDVSPDKIPESIVQKAIDHAKARIAAGKSPFADPSESPK